MLTCDHVLRHNVVVLQFPPVSAVIVMFALPGSQVGWDAIFLALLTTTAGLSMPDALAVAIVVRVQQLCIMGLGAFALTWLARTNPETEE